MIDSGDEDEHMEISEDDTVFNTLEEEFVNVEDLLSSEIWEETNICDVEEDFPPNESVVNALYGCSYKLSWSILKHIVV